MFEPVVVDTLGAEVGDAESLVGGTGDKPGAPSGVRRAARERKQVKRTTSPVLPERSMNLQPWSWSWPRQN